jgi:hypothetical protein
VYRFCNSVASVLVTVSILAGITVLGLWATRRRSLDAVKWQAFLIFLVVGLALLTGYLQFNERIAYMPMARYFFIMLLPGGLLLTGGAYALAARLSLRAAACAVLFMGLAPLNAFGLMTVKEAGVAVGGVRKGTLHGNRYADGLQMLALQENYGIPSLQTLQ